MYVITCQCDVYHFSYITQPQTNTPGLMFRRRSFEVFRQSLDLNGDLERRKMEAAASYAAARSALKTTV